MASAESDRSGKKPVFRHIGLYGHSVGTLTAEPSGVRWKAVDDGISHSKSLPKEDIGLVSWTIFGRSGHLRVFVSGRGDARDQEYRFDGFDPSDAAKVERTFHDLYGVTVRRHTMSSSGYSFGKADISGGKLVYRQCIVDEDGEDGEDGDEMLTMDLGEVSQCVLPGNNRNEIELQFHESDTSEQGADQCVQIRFYVPPDPAATDADAPTNAENFQRRIMKEAEIKNTAGNVIAEFDDSKGTFLTPRGRYAIELFDSFLRMRGNKYDYKIKYDDISRLFLLPRPDEVHMAFVIALDKPIRQGQQRYAYLVLQTNKDPAEVAISLDEETMKTEYGGALQSVMTGSLANLIAKTFKSITRKKVFIPGKFTSFNGVSCVKCALRANEGHLYPLEKQLIFIHKPAVLIRFDEVEHVEFLRYAGGQGSTRNFDLSVSLKGGGGGADDGVGGGAREYTFSGIDRSEYETLNRFLVGKKIKILNLQDNHGAPPPKIPSFGDGDYGDDDDDDAAGKKDDGEEESEDEDYDADAAAAEEEESESDEEDSDDDVSEGTDEDVEEARARAKEEKLKEQRKKQKEKEKEKKQEKERQRQQQKEKGRSKDDDDSSKKKTKKRPLSESGKNSSSSTKKTKQTKQTKQTKLSLTNTKSSKKARVKKEDSNSDSDSGSDEDNTTVTTNSSSGNKQKKRPSKKSAKKDANAPKKPLSTFMCFSREERAVIKEANPDASFGELAKLISNEYKALDEDAMRKYKDMAAEDKKRYAKEMESYTPPPDNGDSDSDDKKKKKKKDPNAPKKNLNSYTFFCQANRARLVRENPDAKFAELSKLQAAAYKKINAEEKKKCEEMARKDKERYQLEFAAYTAKQKEKGVDVGGGTSGSSKKKRAPAPKKKPQRQQPPSESEDESSEEDSDSEDSDSDSDSDSD